MLGDGEERAKMGIREGTGGMGKKGVKRVPGRVLGRMGQKGGLAW